MDFPCISEWITSTWTLLPNYFPFLTIRLHFAFVWKTPLLEIFTFISFEIIRKSLIPFATDAEWHYEGQKCTLQLPVVPDPAKYLIACLTIQVCVTPLTIAGPLTQLKLNAYLSAL